MQGVVWASSGSHVSGVLVDTKFLAARRQYCRESMHALFSSENVDNSIAEGAEKNRRNPYCADYSMSPLLLTGKSILLLKNYPS